MAWQTANLQLPPSIAAVGDSLGDVIDGAGAVAASVGARLSALTSTSFSLGDLASAAEAATSARTSFDEAMNTTAHFCCVHPFIAGAREPGTQNHYLAFPNAVKHLAAKLLDPHDSGRPSFGSDGAALALNISGKNLQDFQTKLQTFNAVFPVAPLMMAERRCTALLQQESTRYTIQQPAMEPSFQSLPLASLPTVQAVKRAVGQRLSMAESYNVENTSPVAELAALISEKAAHAAEQVGAYTALLDQFSGSPCGALYIEGDTPRDLQSALLSAENGRQFDHGMTAMLLFIGVPSDLLFLRQLFGV